MWIQRPPELGAQGSQESLTNEEVKQANGGGGPQQKQPWGAACTWHWLQAWGHNGEEGAYLLSHLYPPLQGWNPLPLPFPFSVMLLN